MTARVAPPSGGKEEKQLFFKVPRGGPSAPSPPEAGAGPRAPHTQTLPPPSPTAPPQAKDITYHSKQIYALGWNCDGTMMATGSADATAGVWSVDHRGCPKDRPERSLKGHTKCVDDLGWHPSARDVLATCAREDRWVGVWDSVNGRLTRKIKTAEGNWRLAWRPDGGELATCNRGRTVCFLGLKSGLVERTHQAREDINGMAWTRVSSGGGGPPGRHGGRGRRRRATPARPRPPPPGARPGPPPPRRGTAPPRDPPPPPAPRPPQKGDLFVITTHTGVDVLRYPELTPVRSLHGHAYCCYAVAVSPCDRYLATGGHDGTVIVWSLGEMCAVSVASAASSGVRHLAFSADSRRVALTAKDRSVCVVSAASGALLFRDELPGDQAEAFLFHPRKPTLVAAGRRVKVFSPAEPGADKAGAGRPGDDTGAAVARPLDGGAPPFEPPAGRRAGARDAGGREPGYGPARGERGAHGAAGYAGRRYNDAPYAPPAGRLAGQRGAGPPGMYGDRRW